MAYTIQEEDAPFEIKPNPIVSDPEAPSAWTCLAHELPAILEWVDQQLGLNCF
jgi:hypothetical protein